MKLTASLKSNLILVGLAAATVTAVLATRHAPTTSETEERAQNLLPFWRTDELSRIEVSGSGAHFALVKEKDDAGEPEWWLEGPAREAADPEAADRLVGALGSATPLRSSEASTNEAGITSKSPSLHLEVGGIRYELRLGKAAITPPGASYLELRATAAPRSGMYLVDKDVAHLFDGSSDEFRKKILWSWGRSSLKKLSIEHSQNELVFTKDDHAGFKLGSGARANRDAVDHVLVGLSRLSSERFLSPAQTDPLLRGESVTRIRAESTEGESIELLLGPPCPDNPQQVIAVLKAPSRMDACVDGAIFRELRLEPAAFIDHSPFSVHQDEVEELRIERDGKRFTLTRKGAAFVLREPVEADVSLEVGNARLDAIVGAPGVIVENPNMKELGLEPVAGRASVRSPGDPKPFDETVVLGKPQKDGSLPLRREDGVVLMLTRDGARAFQPDTTLLRRLTLFSFSGSELVGLELDHPERQIVERNAAGNYSFSEPKGFQVDPNLMTDLGFELGALSAERWVADTDDGSFGLASPSAVAKITYKSGDAGISSRTIRFGASTTGGFYARFEDDPAVFVVGREVLEHVTTLLVDRAGFAPDPASLARVVLRHAGKSIELEDRGGALTPTVPEHFPPNQAQAIVDCLSTLRPEAALHTGPARAHEGLVKPELEVDFERKQGPNARILFGAQDTYRGLEIVYVRLEGSAATFVVAKGKVRALFDSF